MLANMRSGALPDGARILRVLREPGHVLHKQVFLRGAGIDAQASSFRKSRSLFRVAHQNRLADAHQPYGDARCFTGCRISKVDTSVDGGGDQPEFSLRSIADAENPIVMEQRFDGAPQVFGCKITRDKKRDVYT